MLLNIIHATIFCTTAQKEGDTLIINDLDVLLFVLFQLKLLSY